MSRLPLRPFWYVRFWVLLFALRNGFCFTLLTRRNILSFFTPRLNYVIDLRSYLPLTCYVRFWVLLSWFSLRNGFCFTLLSQVIFRLFFTPRLNYVILSFNIFTYLTLRSILPSFVMSFANSLAFRFSCGISSFFITCSNYVKLSLNIFMHLTLSNILLSFLCPH